jgi:1-acyl-sn-glycerol-3-phosphate acyltransferase
MLNTLVYAFLFCTGMVFTALPLGMYHLIRITLPRKTADSFGYFVTRIWARCTIRGTRSTVTVSGWENLTNQHNVCFISNHQGLMDIPLIMGWLDRAVGFVAKKELQKVPVLSGWMRAIHSVFLDRSNARKAVESINTAAETIRQGHAIVIFPEGTRSKTGKIGEFKTGSLKLAFNAEAIIQPLSISGTRNIYEKNKRIRKSQIFVHIHPAIYPEEEIYQDKQRLIAFLQENISQVYNQLGKTAV